MLPTQYGILHRKRCARSYDNALSARKPTESRRLKARVFLPFPEGDNKNNAGKLLGAAGLSALAAPAINADIVGSVTIPTGGLNPPSAPTTGDTNWDVDGDGDGTIDFRLRRVTYSTFGRQVSHNFDDVGGGRLVAPAAIREGEGGIAPLNCVETIGATLAPGFRFHVNAQSSNQILRTGAISSVEAGWRPGIPEFFGFRFTSGGDTHYGWGEMLIAADRSSFTITRAWYEDVAGASIRAGDTRTIPEPAEIGLGLGALALGAAGLRRTRRAKADKAGS